MPISPKLLEELAAKRKVALSGGGPEKLADRKKKGLHTARERLESFFDGGRFLELGLHVEHSCADFGMAEKHMAGDGVITAIGYVNGRPLAAFAQDFTVGGGAVGRMHAKKICDLLDYAKQSGMPVIGINDSGGARIQEGDEALAGYGQIFFRNTLLSGVVPQISVIAGPCAGGAAYSPALTDFIIMAKNGAQMFICGPEVIKAATGQTVTMDDVGSAITHASVSGNIHFIADSGVEALQIAKKLHSFLPSNNVMDPPHHLNVPLDMTPDPALNDIMPADGKEAFDVKLVINRLVDAADFLEVQRDFARNMVVGFGRVQGIITGFIANQPNFKAGTIDIDASDKASRFIRFCNIFNIPLVTLVDTGGFLPGIQQERGGIIRHGAKMLFAYSAATVPKLTVIMRKAYGGAYLAMCSKDLGADFVFAWPTAEIAVMGAAGAVNILFKKEIAAAGDKPAQAAKAAELAAEYRAKFAAPYEAAGKAFITDIIEPAETRGKLAMALRATLSKRETRPPKKHGNIPL
jgi:propionyl-CoA carboxylase beta chain